MSLSHPVPLGQPLIGHTAAVNSVRFSPNGHMLASGSADDTIRLWNLTDPDPTGTGWPAPATNLRTLSNSRPQAYRKSQSLTRDGGSTYTACGGKPTTFSGIATS